ncbi:hypothetical protein GGS26DRAFT_591392 [Hypomontagnella submonticulosa]|nr:hypothetical protein GGS26DRAFT_591392 [Hypomontagnella submonticulosa]
MRARNIISLLFLASTAGASPDKRDDCPSNVTQTSQTKITATTATTVTVGETTFYKFLSGSPEKTGAPDISTFRARPAVVDFAPDDCPPVTTTVISETTSVVVTSTATESVATVMTSVYPCANMIDNLGPAYGDANATNSLAQQNTLYPLSDSRGTSAQSCCETCYFNATNCVQAWWYFYEGCVVSVATNLTAGTGSNESPACPRGTFSGLTYGPDKDPAFRSTGNIAGPCGEGYTNF